MKVLEAIELIDKANVYSMYDAEEELKSLEQVKSGLDVDKHRWYETSTTVFKCEDGFVGVNGPSDLFSENMSFSDCSHKCTAKQMYEKSTITYSDRQ